MKATYNGITMEGTPSEIAELKRLIDAQYKVTYTQPYTPFVPWKPQTNTYTTTYGPTGGGITWTSTNTNGNDIRIKTTNVI